MPNMQILHIDMRVARNVKSKKLYSGCQIFRSHSTKFTRHKYEMIVYLPMAANNLLCSNLFFFSGKKCEGLLSQRLVVKRQSLQKLKAVKLTANKPSI